MATLGITGRRSTITKEFLALKPDAEVVYGAAESLPLDLDEYVFCAGVLYGKSALDITDDQAWETMKVNYVDVVRACERIFAVNERARICVIGSYSGIKGSYDTIYAGAKSALHLYIQTKKLSHATQHLVAVAPTIIIDSGMTERRYDIDSIMERGKKSHLGRWLTAAEVARSVNFALNESVLCNTIIPLTGGIN